MLYILNFILSKFVVEMKKIAIDISYYWKMCWYWIVTNNLLKKILEKDEWNYFYLISNEEKNLSELNDLKNWEFVCTNTSFIMHKFLILPKYLKRYWIDIYFSFDQDIPIKKVCKYIIISHDIWWIVLWKQKLFSMMKKWLNLKNTIYHLLWLEKRAAKKSDLIFCPSENTKNDLIREFWVDSGKIHVTYWWLDHLKWSRISGKENYILFPFSNLYNDFQYWLANEILEKKFADKIIFLRPAFINNDMKLHKWITIVNNRISEDDLIKYYSKAKLSIYLSDYDGFWFPPLESVFYWTPVLCNDNSCLPEILNNLWIIHSLTINTFIEYLSTQDLNNLLLQQEMLIKKYNREITSIEILKHLKEKC